ncbi:MAG: PhoPQ-activated pathogenicity-related family protein [Candidatus Eremiobacteraeota bacterium]|nr:PhoPQ-activated pathogenicity-related family protein [Candidatus Eremiobacteraeota bacterium]
MDSRTRLLTRLEFLNMTAGAGVSLALTPLERYINAPDDAYGYRLIKTFTDDPRYRGYVLELTSQQWRTSRDVDRSVWKHWITIVEPQDVRTDISALVVGGGSNADPVPAKVPRYLVMLSLATYSVTCEVSCIPNQPLTFTGEGQPRSEDDLVAYSWLQYLRTGDDSWPLRLPMTKSVVRAMDAVSDFCRRNGNGVNVKRFVVGGTSKRGWTTWMTAAADSRVAAIVPIVIDVLNMRRTVDHTYRTYGRWPQAWSSYEALGIFDWLGTPQMDSLLQIEDPFTYRERLTMPKLIVNATGDEFFVPDSSQFYFNALPGRNYLRYVPNSDHSMTNTHPEQARTLLAFYRSLIEGSRAPNITWRDSEDGTIDVHLERPASARLWRATNPISRDFRLQTIGKAFESTDLVEGANHTFVAPAAPVRRGWEASFIEVTYKDVAGQPFTISSDVRITPDTLPFGPPQLKKAS